MRASGASRATSARNLVREILGDAAELGPAGQELGQQHLAAKLAAALV
jgi:hypothetical protein